MKYGAILSFFSALLLLSCGPADSDQDQQVVEVDSLSTVEVADLFIPIEKVASKFESRNLDGTLVIYDEALDRYQVYNEARADSPLLPASTFKIINSLIALETGAVSSVEDTLKWDGVERWSEAWNQDQTMRSAIKYSCVWFYQELARRAGETEMQKLVMASDYGNGDISGGIDQFWLRGNIRITAKEQVEFLRKLQHGDLPFTAKNMDAVKDITTLEKNERYTLHGKTGWAVLEDRQYGWWVGWVEREERNVYFAINIEFNSNEDRRFREEIMREVLQEMELID